MQRVCSTVFKHLPQTFSSTCTMASSAEDKYLSRKDCPSLPAASDVAVSSMARRFLPWISSPSVKYGAHRSSYGSEKVNLRCYLLQLGQTRPFISPRTSRVYRRQFGPKNSRRRNPPSYLTNLGDEVEQIASGSSDPLKAAQTQETGNTQMPPRSQCFSGPDQVTAGCRNKTCENPCKAVAQRA